jgi:hypothetical protein
MHICRDRSVSSEHGRANRPCLVLYPPEYVYIYSFGTLHCDVSDGLLVASVMPHAAEMPFARIRS